MYAYSDILPTDFRMFMVIQRVRTCILLHKRETKNVEIKQCDWKQKSRIGTEGNTQIYFLYTCPNSSPDRFIFNLVVWNNYRFIGSCKDSTELFPLPFAQFPCSGHMLHNESTTPTPRLGHWYNMCASRSFYHMCIFLWQSSQPRYTTISSPPRSPFCSPSMVTPMPLSPTIPNPWQSLISSPSP